MKLSKTEIIRVAGARNETMADVQSTLNQYLDMYQKHHASLGDAAEAAKYSSRVQVNGDVADKATYEIMNKLLSLKAGRDYKNFDQMLGIMRRALVDHRDLLESTKRKTEQKPAANNLVKLVNPYAAPHSSSVPTIQDGRAAYVDLNLED